jgi:succinoglycan biosynthesis protein ExoA
MTAPSNLPDGGIRASGAGPTTLVTLVVAVRNEAGSLAACLGSMLDQDYPQDRLEILVYDGESTDGSFQIASELLRGRPLAAVRANPRRIQAAAWNLGIAEGTGDVLGILSGHARIGRGYVRAAVAALSSTGADMVGGPVHAVGEGVVAEAIAVATSGPFGAGGARFRLANRVEQVDTVFMGVAARSTYVRFPFDEEMVRNQDDELSYRLLDAGARIVCDPAITSEYRSRSTLRGLARQYYAYGFWKVRVAQKHPAQVRVRHLVPPAFVLGLALAAVATAAGGVLRLAGLTLLGAYLLANLAATVTAARNHPRLLPVLPLVYANLHVAYGIGFLVGLVHFRASWPRGAFRTVAAALISRR